jgi:hypothetical protein
MHFAFMPRLILHPAIVFALKQSKIFTNRRNRPQGCTAGTGMSEAKAKRKLEGESGRRADRPAFHFNQTLS